MDIANFCQQNGLTFLNILMLDPNMKMELMNVIEALENTQIRFRILDTNKGRIRLNIFST